MGHTGNLTIYAPAHILSIDKDTYLAVITKSGCNFRRSSANKRGTVTSGVPLPINEEL